MRELPTTALARNSPLASLKKKNSKGFGVRDYFHPKGKEQPGITAGLAETVRLLPTLVAQPIKIILLGLGDPWVLESLGAVGDD